MITSNAPGLMAAHALRANIGQYRAPVAQRSAALESRSSIPFTPRNVARPSGPASNLV
jgi:hypothetical protein